jgi:hypothetical protein
MDNLSPRAYFAAHAPAVPDWFNPKPTVTRPDRRIEDFSGMNAHERAAMRHELAVETAKWASEQQEHRFFAWAWHYADMMLEHQG